MNDSILRLAIENNVRSAIEEDVGKGDLTALLVPEQQTGLATIISRQPAIICGIAWAERCFKMLDANTDIEWLVSDGNRVGPHETLCTIRGNARALLTAERCALNFLQTLSATATLTRAYANAVSGTGAQILDTRKTLPGLRIAQKYAVGIGGGMNQRLGLHEGILIKENHIVAAGGIEPVLDAATAINKDVPIQIEVETLLQFQQALQADAKLILLDNFTTEELIEAVNLNAGRAILEASGGIDLSNVRDVALTGVDRISIGSLTKNISAIDLSMRFSA